MRRNKTVITVFVLLIPALILYLIISIATKKRPAAPEKIDAANQTALAYMKAEMRDLTDRLLGDFPGDVNLIIAASKFYKQCNNPDRVMMLIENGLKYNPQSFELCKIASQVAFGTGQYDQAVTFGKKALANNPKDPEMYEDVADALIFSGESRQAVDLIKEKHRAFGGSARSYRLLGKGHLRGVPALAVA